MFDLYATLFGRYLAEALADGPAKTELLDQIRQLVSSLSPHGKFPGPNPCSIERRDFRHLQDEYWLCEKTDGLRALLVCVTFRGEHVVVLVSRKWDPYLLKIRHAPRVWFQGTVFDGELVQTSDTTWAWLCFDAVCVAGVPVWRLPLSQRLDAVQRSFKDYRLTPGDDVVLRIKRFFKARGEQQQYRDHLDTVPYPVDGTILTPEKDPVVVGRHTGLYKLKTKHSVDFLFTPPNVLSVYDPGAKNHVAVAKLKLTKQSAIPQANSIIECLPTSARAEWWTQVGLRTDKPTANDVLTFTKTKVNIRENLGLEDILRAFR